jgi:hypothetical protein
MNIFGIEISLWRICFISVLLSLLALKFYLEMRIYEGFQSGEQPFDKLVGCPTLQTSINNHKQYLKEYTERAAVVSMKNTEDVLEHFTNTYNEHDCDAFIKSMPVKEKVETEAKAEANA